MVGSATVRALREKGFSNLLTASHAELDLTDQKAVFDFFAAHKPDCQIICAALVGGIVANNNYPGDFIGQNLMIQTNLLEAARRFNCGVTVFLASGCIYPREVAQPMKEEYLLTGALEPTNQWYAVAKLAGIKMGQAYRRQFGMNIISALPANLYGPGDSFDLETSHVLPALLRKFHEASINAAPSVTVWGSGTVQREFLHVDDLGRALVFLCQKELSEDLFNIGYGDDLTITELAEVIKEVVGYEGEIDYDTTKPDGAPRKLLDSSRLRALGWRPTISLREGITATYHWFLQNVAHLREVRPEQWRAGG